DSAARAGTVTIVVSHRLSTTPLADLVLVMADGRLVECGRHDDLMGADGQYARLFRLHSAGEERAAFDAPFTSTLPELVVWDIDRTLVDAGPATHDAFEGALDAVCPGAKAD